MKKSMTRQIVITTEWLELVEDWRRHQTPVPNISTAIRTMVEIAAQAENKKRNIDNGVFEEIYLYDGKLSELYLTARLMSRYAISRYEAQSSIQRWLDKGHIGLDNNMLFVVKAK